jgi:hypothetical protein
VCRVLNWNFCPNSDGSSVNGYRHSNVIWETSFPLFHKNWLLQSILCFFSPKFISAVGPYSTHTKQAFPVLYLFERGRGHLMVFYLLFLRAPTLIRPSWDKGKLFHFLKIEYEGGSSSIGDFLPFFCWSRIDFLRVVKSSTTKKKNLGSSPLHSTRHLIWRGGHCATVKHIEGD